LPAADNDLTIVVSDLHIGSRGFGDEKEFMRLCLLVKTLGARMVVNGDTFDMAEYGFDLQSAIKNNRTLLRAIHQNNGILVNGNHDDNLSSFQFELPGQPAARFDPVAKIEMDGIYIEHGHQAGKMFEHSWWKPLYLPVSFLEKAFGHWALKWLELIQREAYNIASSFANLFRLPANKVDLWERTKVRSIVERARVLYREHGSQKLTIIIGHEHFAGVAATLKKVIDAIRRDPEIGGGKVKFYCSGGCKGREGYAADFLVIDRSDPKDPKVYPFVWEYTHDPVIVFKKAA
jgi:UDP-2,3-diacylglucosamine pyrophosphatase LpxH